MKEVDTDIFRAVADVRYAIRVNLLHRRLYRKSRRIAVLIATIGGGGALLTAFKDAPFVTSWLAVVAATATACDRAFDLSERAARRSTLIEKYQRLLLAPANAAELEAQREAVSIGATDDDIECLRKIAYNDVLLETGSSSDPFPEGRRTRLWRFLA